MSGFTQVVALVIEKSFVHLSNTVSMRTCAAHYYDTAFGAPGGLRQLSADFGSGHDLTVREFEPRVGLCADSSEPGPCFRFCVSLSLTLPCSCSASPCLKNK